MGLEHEDAGMLEYGEAEAPMDADDDNAMDLDDEEGRTHMLPSYDVFHPDDATNRLTVGRFLKRKMDEATAALERAKCRRMVTELELAFQERLAMTPKERLEHSEFMATTVGLLDRAKGAYAMGPIDSRSVTIHDALGVYFDGATSFMLDLPRVEWKAEVLEVARRLGEAEVARSTVAFYLWMVGHTAYHCLIFHVENDLFATWLRSPAQAREHFEPPLASSTSVVPQSAMPRHVRYAFLSWLDDLLDFADAASTYNNYHTIVDMKVGGPSVF